jgi:hypothetical protein
MSKIENDTGLIPEPIGPTGGSDSDREYFPQCNLNVTVSGIVDIALTFSILVSHDDFQLFNVRKQNRGTERTLKFVHR